MKSHVANPAKVAVLAGVLFVAGAALSAGPCAQSSSSTPPIATAATAASATTSSTVTAPHASDSAKAAPASSSVEAWVSASGTPAPSLRRAGIYNSRQVALAYGRSDLFKKAVNQLAEEGQKAVSSGDKARLADLKKEGAAMQDRLHRQVFGSAPIDDVLKAIEKSIPGILAKAGVEQLVSEKQAAQLSPQIEKVDVTALLAAEFHPNEKTQKIMNEMIKHTPLPDSAFPLKD